MSTLIHPTPYRANQIALGRIIFQLGRPSARFALTCNRLELHVSRHFSDTPHRCALSSSRGFVALNFADGPVQRENAELERRERRMLSWGS